MRLLMHPDIGSAITDAALQDAEHPDAAIESGSDASASLASARAPAARPGAGAGAGPGPMAARRFGPMGPSPHGGRSRALSSTATPSEASEVSARTEGDSRSAGSTAPSTIASTSSSRGGTKKRASTASGASAAKKPKFASVLAEKHDLLFRMNRMATRGGKQSRPMTVKDSLDELRCECERMQREIEVDKSVKFQRSLMTSFATGVECLNARWNFAGLKLDGWSQSVQDDLDNYDEVFEELHAKYATKSSMPPEIKLVMMIASSAFMFHMSKSMFSSVPGMEEAMRDDPELARAVAAAVAKKAQKNETVPERRGMAGMFANIMGNGQGAATSASLPAAVGRPMTPPDADSIAGIERLFSDDDSESDAASVRKRGSNVGGAASPARSQASARSSVDGSMVLDSERGMILDA